VRFTWRTRNPLYSKRRSVIPRNIKQAIEILNSASTKLREVKMFEDDNVVKELTAKFNDNAAKVKQLYSQYKVNDAALFHILFVDTDINW
jgi:hypothetical protein